MNVKLSRKSDKDMNNKFLQFLQNENAINVVFGQILNFTILIIITGGIIGAFYLREEDSSNQAMRIEFTDLGNQIARDISNIYIIASHSDASNEIYLNIKRDIPLTIGGRGYSIELKDANSTNDKMASVSIKEEGVSGYQTITKINSVGPVNIGGIVHSGSGEINITAHKNNSGIWTWLK